MATKAVRKVAAKDDDDDDDLDDDDDGPSSTAGRSYRTEAVVQEDELPPAFVQDHLLSPVLANERRLRGTFAVLPSGTVDRLSVFKLSKEFDETAIRVFATAVWQFAVLGGPRLLCRDATLAVLEELHRRHAAANADRPLVLLDGGKGTGKSVVMLQGVANALAQGWLVVYIPSLQLFTLPKYPYAPTRPLHDDEIPSLPDDPEAGVVGRAAAASAASGGPDLALAGTLPKANVAPLRYHQPELCSLLLKHVRAVNGERLDQVKVGTAWKFGTKQLGPESTLGDLVQIGVDSHAQAPAVAVALLQELATQTAYAEGCTRLVRPCDRSGARTSSSPAAGLWARPGRALLISAPVLLALDQVNALVNPTSYYDAYSRLIWPESFAVQRELLEFVRGERRLTRGMVLGATSWQDSRMPRHLWQRQVSRGIANVVRVPPYNQAEMSAMLQLVEARQAISSDSLQTHGNAGSIRGLTNGNAREFLRLAGIL